MPANSPSTRTPTELTSNGMSRPSAWTELHARHQLEVGVGAHGREEHALGLGPVVVDDRVVGRADEIARLAAERPADRLGHVAEAPVGIDGEDDVRRVVDEEPVALLGATQLVLQAIALAHVADRAVGPAELAGGIERGDRDELGGHGRAVPMEQADAAAQLLGRGGHGQRPVDLGDVARRLVDDGPEVLAQELLGLEPGQPLAGVGQEGQLRVGVDGPDQVRGVLDEVAVALLGAAQLALQAGPLADVADRALVADPAAVLEHAGRGDLGLEGRAVAAHEQERDALDDVRGGADGHVLLAGQGHRPGVGQEREVLADDLGDGPAEEGLAAVGHEREVALGVGPPDDVRRRLDETPEAGLLAGQALEQVRVGQGDGRLVGQPGQQVELVGLEHARLGAGHGERAHDVAAGRPEGRRGHAPQLERVGDSRSEASCGMRGSVR